VAGEHEQVVVDSILNIDLLMEGRGSSRRWSRGRAKRMTDHSRR
jgi:hypothetical protein